MVTAAENGHEIMKMRKPVLATLAAYLFTTTGVGAWGVTAHRAISRVAVATLPADVPAFLVRQIDWIAVRSTTPDTWRDASEPFLKIEEDPNHGWFMEQFAFMKTIPRSRYDFVLAVYDEQRRLAATDPARAALTNVRWTGTLPYAAAETYERLKVAFRNWRQVSKDSREAAFIELDAAFYVGWLSHYIADGAMPLHTSIHHDGWQGDNPNGYTRDPSIHWRFESEFVDQIGLKDADIRPRVAAPTRRPDAFDAVLDHLNRSHTRVEQVYALDRAGALTDASNRDAKALVVTCTGDAATLLRDLIYTAWLASGEKGVGDRE